MLTGRLISSTFQIFQNAKFSNVSSSSDLTHLTYLTHLTLFMRFTQVFRCQCAPIFLVGIRCRFALNFCHRLFNSLATLVAPLSYRALIGPSFPQQSRLRNFQAIPAERRRLEFRIYIAGVIVLAVSAKP